MRFVCILGLDGVVSNKTNYMIYVLINTKVANSAYRCARKRLRLKKRFYKRLSYQQDGGGKKLQHVHVVFFQLGNVNTVPHGNLHFANVGFF